MMFLSAEELRTLTGYKRAADQRRWLEKRGWAFEVRGDGKNSVLIEEAKSRMLTRRAHQRATEPNLVALRNLR